MKQQAKAILRQLTPPVFLSLGRMLLKALEKQFAIDPTVNALKLKFERRTAKVCEDEIAVRENLILKLHPDSRHAFEYFCYLSPAMVEEMESFIDLTRSRRRLLDIGALHGIFSLVFAATSPSKQAVAVDASPIAFARLLYNIYKNKLPNITPVECAMSDDSGVLRMHYEGEHAVAARTGGGDQKQLLVVKRTGDDLCRELQFQPDVVKIDVEGHEVKIVRGLSQTVKSLKPLVFLELHPPLILEENDNIDDLLQVFVNCGYGVSSTSGKPVSMGDVARFTDDQRLVFTPLGQRQGRR